MKPCKRRGAKSLFRYCPLCMRTVRLSAHARATAVKKVKRMRESVERRSIEGKLTPGGF